MAMDAESDSKACAEYAALLEDYVAGELVGHSAHDIENHLQACSACREAVELARLGAQLLRTGPQSVGEPGPAFAGQVMARIRAEEEQGSAREDRFWRPLEALAWRMTLSAALALTLLVAYGLKARPEPPAFTTTSQLQTGSLFESVQQPSTGDDVLLSLAESQNNHGK
jgi:anti-sigma factor RsiW